MPDALPWIACAVAAVAATAAIAQWRSAAAALARSRGEQEAAETELRALRDETAKRERRRDDQSGELRDLRKRLDKTKRRAFESQAEIEPLQQQVARLEAELAAKTRALAEGADALARAEALVAQAETARDAARAELASAVAAAERATPPPAEPAPSAELETLRKELAAQRRRASDAEREGARFRQRWRTEQRAYMVIRGELEIAKDRIRALEGRPPREKRHAPPLIPGTPIERGEVAAPDVDAERSELN